MYLTESSSNFKSEMLTVKLVQVQHGFPRVRENGYTINVSQSIRCLCLFLSNLFKSYGLATSTSVHLSLQTISTS